MVRAIGEVEYVSRLLVVLLGRLTCLAGRNV